MQVLALREVKKLKWAFFFAHAYLILFYTKISQVFQSKEQKVLC